MPPSSIMLSRELQVTLQLAMTEALNRRHEFVCLEHLLYAMLHDSTATNIIQSCGADMMRLRKRLENFLDQKIEALPAGSETAPRYSLAVQRVLQRAAAHVQSAGRQELTGANVLAAMFSEGDSHAVYFLQEEEVTRFDVVNFISHGVSKVGADEDRQVRGTQEHEEDSEHEEEDEHGRKFSPSKALEAYTVNLNQKAAKGQIDPLVGRKNELERAIHVLLRRRKNNPVFVGEAGVGKTALAEGLALAIHHGKVPAALKQAEILAVDMGALLAGTHR